MEIGGFRTETVTEDIHTSMVIHAKGYRSCYLNKVLAVGLMPETFERSIKQRVRWAMGHVQILFQTNPFTMRGLTLPQRIRLLRVHLLFPPWSSSGHLPCRPAVCPAVRDYPCHGGCPVARQLFRILLSGDARDAEDCQPGDAQCVLVGHL